jgi:hypothetical protein
MGCTGSSDQGEGTDTAATPTPCEITVVQTVPAADETGVYHRADIEFHLSEADPTATILADVPGTVHTSAEGTIILFSPDEPLATSSWHTVTLDYCHGSPTLSFETSDLGDAMPDPSVVVGQAFLLDLTEARLLAGSALGDLLQTYFSRPVMAQILGLEGGELHLRTAVTDPEAAGAAQEMCFRSFDVTGVDFSSAPYFDFAAAEVQVDNFAAPITFQDFHVDGTIASDASWLGGIRFSGVLDVRELAATMDSDPDTLCTLAANLGTPCEPCPTDMSAHCVTLSSDQIYGEAIDLDIVEITEPYSHADCDQAAPKE